MESFQAKHHRFVEKNALPEKKGDKVSIKYYATLEKIIEKPVSRILPGKYYIWTRDHVKTYMKLEQPLSGHYELSLKNPYWADPTPGAIRFANLKEEVSLEGMEPVLNNSDFGKLIK